MEGYFLLLYRQKKDRVAEVHILSDNPPMIHTCDITVRSYELDSYNHVNNAVFLQYCEYARMKFLEDIHFAYNDAYNNGYRIVIASANLQYKKPALLYDQLKIFTEPIKRNRISGVFKQWIQRGEEVLFSAEIKWVCCDNLGKPASMPEKYDRPELYPGQ